MSCCCNSKASKKFSHHCPECEMPCLSISYQTLIHHVQFPENQSITEEDYSHCTNQKCDVAYFSTSNIIFKRKIREFKDNQDVMLCYCFDITQSQYQSALEQGVSKPIKNFVIQQTKQGRCACKTRNPSGRCCLANFKSMESNYANQQNNS